MSPQTSRCNNPDIFLSFEDSRPIVLGKYAEKELDPQSESIIRQHLDSCKFCSEFLKQLEEVEEIHILDATFIHASCPSSKELDDYVFKSDALQAAEFQMINAHLRDCALCKEEAAWLRSTEKRIPSVVDRRNWLLYAATAAAIVFMAISTVLFVQRTSIRNTEKRLQAAAVIKEPNQIDYAELRKSSVILPDNMNGVYERGVASLKDRRFQEAIRHLEIVAKAHPDHSGAVYLLGYSYYQMKELERAFELCDRAERMEPKSLERCLSLVQIAMKTGHYDRGIREINGLHHVAPNHPAIKETYERIRTITQGRTLKL